MLKSFVETTSKEEAVEYLTAAEGMALEIRRKRPVTAADLKQIAAELQNRITFVKVDASYLSASEVFSLAAKYLSGRMLVPELLYGPERHEESVIVEPVVSVRELAEAAFRQYDTVMGYRQLKPLYRVGKNLLNPVDLLSTMLVGDPGGHGYRGRYDRRTGSGQIRP